ncbi:MAG: hypothetical protein AAGF73_13225 [Actinomycetota bacterium]
MKTRLAPIVLGAATIAGCATTQQSEPGTTLAATSTTTSAPSATTTTEPTTTVAAETTAAPTTTSAATTAPGTTLPAGPTGDVLPLFVGDGDGLLTPLGQWDGEAWATTSEDATLPDAGREFTLSRLAGPTDGTVDGTAEVCFDERVGPTMTPAGGNASPPNARYNGVALPPPDWPLQPRRVVELGDDVPGYQELGESAFDEFDVDVTAGAVEQLVIADLDGDGNTEALVVFERIQEPTPGSPEVVLGSPGDFSGLLLVDTESRAATTVLSSVVTDDGDELSIEFLEQFRVLDVADYNGDGRMEVAVNAWYYEGAGVAVFTFDDSELDEALAVGCGL